jgi:anti-sigma B factor antagonist
MKATIRNEGEVTILELSGYVDYDSTDPLHHSLSQIYKHSEVPPRLVIDLRGLEFVGSSGVSVLVKSLRNFNKMKIKPTYFGVKSEFLKLFKAFEEEDNFEVSDSKENAVKSSLERYTIYQSVTPRSKRTH